MSSEGLIALLRSPQSIIHVSDAQWNELVEQGRKTQLLGQLEALFQREKLMDKVPAAVQRHLMLARLTVRRRSESAMWEVATMRRAVNPKIPLVLLKGCAYVACADEPAAGRIFSDIDVLVPRQNLSAVESDLMAVGWKPSRVNGYDLSYYRNWMHEVPPMEHMRRHTVVDLHHAINPPVSRFYINPEQLFEHIVEIRPGVFVLSATDRVIHCGLHLLQEGEPRRLIRDLYDFQLLLAQHHGSAAGLEQLCRRARALGVEALMDAAAGAAQALFVHESNGGWQTGWLQACLERAATEANGNTTVKGELAGLALLAYAHWMKMPLKLLVPHLMHKTRARMTFNKNSGFVQI